MTTPKRLLTALCLATLAGAAMATPDADVQNGALQDLLRTHPGAQVWNDGDRDRIIYGRPMTTADSHRGAVESFLDRHAHVFGAGDLDLVEGWSGDVRFGKFWVYHFTQEIDGLPVESSVGRVLARNNLDGTWSVVYAAGLFASRPTGGYAPMTMSGQDAIDFIKGTEYAYLPVWSDAELVAFQTEGADGIEATRAWKFVGEVPDLTKREKYTFFVDAATGAVLDVRDEVLRADVTGFVNGWGSPGVLPDIAQNPPVPLPVNDLRVDVSGGNNDFTDGAGFFDISHSGNTDVAISATFDVGEWCNINNQSSGGVLNESGIATPGIDAQLTFNQTPSQLETAQVNAFIHTGLIHNYITDRTSWTGMNFPCTTNVNINSNCNAFFDGGSINFYTSGGGCNNTAYSTVVAHEYGHYMVSRLGLAQGAFGEGFGDTCAHMLYDTGIVGEFFFTSGGAIRNNETTNRTYPCSGGVHFCGQLLAGCWWDMRLNLGDTYGSGAGLTEVQQLFADWFLITSGGQGDNSAHPGTAIEVLTIDDDDGNINNGTPNYDDIAAAFEKHLVDVPDIVPLTFFYPDGVPENISPSGGTTFDVTIFGNTGFDPEPGTGTLHYDDGSGFVAVPMIELDTNEYQAVFPAFECRSEIRFYVSGEATDGTVGQDPQDAPVDAFEALAVESRSVALEDDFEVDLGWTVENDNVNAGAWIRGLVQGGNNPPSDFDGSGKAFVTGNGFGNPDLDGGPTRLHTPVFDLSDMGDPFVTYARWFSASSGESEDRLTIEVSNDGGSTWTVMEDLTDQGEQWTVVSQRIRDYVSLTDNVVVRFSAIDGGSNTTVEAALDAFLLDDVDCGACVADFNDDGSVNTQDVLAFLNAWSAGDSSADVNDDGNVNTQDVLEFLNLWNTGC